MKVKKINIKVLICIILVLIVAILILMFSGKVIYEEKSGTYGVTYHESNIYIYNNGLIKNVSKSEGKKENVYYSYVFKLNDLKKEINKLEEEEKEASKYGDGWTISGKRYAYKNNKKIGLDYSKYPDKNIINLADEILKDKFKIK